MAKRLNGSKWIRPARRQAIYNRDGFCCVYCLASAEEGASLTLDHILSRELGGTHESSNLLTCCLSCNSQKQDMSTRAWFAVLRDKGVDTSKLSKRIARQSARELDMEEGHRLVALRHGGQD